MTLSKHLATMLLAAFALSAQAEPEYHIYDEPIVNGHPGFLTASAVSGPLDKVVIIVPGFTPRTTSCPTTD